MRGTIKVNNNSTTTTTNAGTATTGPQSSSTTGSSSSSCKTYEVQGANRLFSPSNLEINSCDTVHWSWYIQNH